MSIGNIIDKYTIEYEFPVNLTVIGTIVKSQEDKNKTIIKLEESIDDSFIEEKFNNRIVDLTVRSKNNSGGMASVSGCTANSIRVVSLPANVSPDVLAAIFK